MEGTSGYIGKQDYSSPLEGKPVQQPSRREKLPAIHSAFEVVEESTHDPNKLRVALTAMNRIYGSKKLENYWAGNSPVDNKYNQTLNKILEREFDAICAATRKKLSFATNFDMIVDFFDDIEKGQIIRINGMNVSFIDVFSEIGPNGEEFELLTYYDLASGEEKTVYLDLCEVEKCHPTL